MTFQLYSRSPLQSFRLAAQGHGDRIQPPPEHLRETGRARYFDPLPFWYPPFEATRLNDEARLPAARRDPAADGHVPLLGLAERLAAPDPFGYNRLYIPEAVARAHDIGLADDDWVCAGKPHHGTDQGVPVRTSCRASTASTVWTWNAIGKRAGAWNLDPDAAESTPRASCSTI